MVGLSREGLGGCGRASALWPPRPRRPVDVNGGWRMGGDEGGAVN